MATAEHRRNCKRCQERIRRYNHWYYLTFREKIIDQRRRQAPASLKKIGPAIDIAIEVNKDALRALAEA